MENFKGHLRCTTAEEVKERVTSDAIREYYEIQDKIEKERKGGVVVSSILECNWIDKHCVNPYKVERDSISFLVYGEKTCEIVFVFDENFNITQTKIVSR